MKAIFKKDFLSYFRNVVGWLFLGINLVYFGIQMTTYNLLNGYANVNYPLSFLAIVFSIMLPILTMRSFAEERKNKTDQLLYTAPVSVFKIVAGKYLAMLLIFGILCGIICVTPFIMHFYGEIPVSENYLSIFGFFLFGAAEIAIGLFISSLFENVIIAAIVTYVILLFGMFSNTMVSNFGADNLFTKFVSIFNIIGPCDDLFSGVLSLKGIVYYASIIFLCFFLTIQVIEKRRYKISKKTFSFTAFSATGIVIAIAAVICGNVLIQKVPVKYSEIDFTQEKLYKLSKETKSYLKKYKTDTMIYVYGTKSAVSDIEKKTLQEIKETNSHIKVKYVDPSTNPSFAEQYTFDSLSAGSLIVVNNSTTTSNGSGAAASSGSATTAASSQRFKVVSASDIFLTDMDYSTYQSYTTGYDGEGQIISALTYVSSKDMPKIYELTGHDEVAVSGTFSAAIQKLNLEDDSFSFLNTDAVPDDCNLLIINAPQSDFSMNDVTKLKAYIDGGGKVMINFEFSAVSKLTNLKAMLTEYGVTVPDGIVVENDADYYSSSQLFILPNVESTDATTDLIGKLSVITPYSVAMQYNSDDGSGNTYTPILTTSDSSFIKGAYTTADDINNISDGTITKDDSDIAGPLTVGLRVDTSAGGQLTLYGSAYTFVDNTNEIVSGRNEKLFSQSISSAVPDKISDTVSIPSKSYNNSYITVSQKLVMIYGILFSVLLPVFLIIFGIVLWGVRRKY